MAVTKIGKNIFLVDLETCGFKNLIASYVLIGNAVMLIETGPTSSIPTLLKGLAEADVQPNEVKYVAVTHVHIDHSGGVGTLMKNLPKAQVIVHPRGAPHLAHPEKLWAASQQTLGEVAEMFGKPEPVPESRILLASEDSVFDLGRGLQIKVLEAPGHASHNVSYLESLNHAIFPGDAAGAYLKEFDVVFPTTPPPLQPDTALATLDKLIALKPKVLFYSHFGKAKNATQRLLNYKKQILLWARIAEKGVQNADSPESIREKILNEDDTIRKVVPALTANFVHRKTLIENSVYGFIEFYSRRVI